MKSLHKKIGAMVLAGMVVLGGVAAGGVNSFAASNNKVVVKNNLQNSNYQKVKRMANKFNGDIIYNNNNNREFNKYLRKNNLKNNINNKKLLYNNSSYNIKNQCEIALPLNNAKNRGIKFVAIQFYDNYYLIKLNQ